MQIDHKLLASLRTELRQVHPKDLYRAWQDGSASLNDAIRSWKKTYEAMENMDISGLDKADTRHWEKIASDMREATLNLAKVFDKGNREIARLDGSFDDDQLMNV